MLKIVFSLIFAFATTSPVWAANPYVKSLQGHFTQGGYVTGEVVPFAKVTLGQHTATADEKGIFYIELC